MSKGMCRNLWIMLSILLSIAGSAHAQTWTSTPMTVVAKEGTENLNAIAPYSLGWPTAAAPSMRRYLSSSEEASLKGFRIRGYTTTIGSGTDDHNELDAGFTNSSSFTGTEYGLVVYLPDGLLRLYQCTTCNTPTMQWHDDVVFNTPQDYYVYEVTVDQGTGNFTVTIVDAKSGATITTVPVTKQSWMPNAYNLSGYLQITANHGVSTGSWPDGVLHVDEIDMLH
jgi:hypothetical protein